MSPKSKFKHIFQLLRSSKHWRENRFELLTVWTLSAFLAAIMIQAGYFFQSLYYPFMVVGAATAVSIKVIMSDDKKEEADFTVKLVD